MIRRRRTVALVLALLHIAALATPIVHAQVSESAGFQAMPTRSDGTRPGSREEYVSDVQGRVSLRQELESRYSDLQTLREQARRRLEELKISGPPPGVDPAAYERYKQQQTRELESLISQSDRNQGSMRDRLGQIYQQLTRDQQFLRSSGDAKLTQELGPLIGVGGTALVPVSGRPSLGNIGGQRAQNTRIADLTKLNGELQTSISTRNTLAARVGSAQPPTAGDWVTEVGANGNVQLRNGQQVHDLGLPSETRSANGQPIRNAEAFQKAQYFRDLYQAQTRIETAKASLVQQKSQTTDAKTIKKLDTKIAELDTKRSQLEGDINDYNSKNPKRGSTLGNLAGSAAKWALMSTGITVASNVISQMSQNGWDPKNINWQSAIAPLKTAEFWGGTAGSFGLSMVASMIPGGTFIKTLASIGGAAIGWQLGTGNIGNTDWKQLAVSTVGATLGSVLGGAIGGPIGAFLGGIAGQWAANWLMNKLDEYMSQGSSYNAPPDRPATQTTVDPYTNLGNYTGRPVGGSGTTPSGGSGSGAASGDAASIKAQMDKVYTEIDMINRSDNPNRDRIGQLQRQLVDLQNQMRQLRQAGPTGER